MSTPNESVENSRLLRYGRQPKMQTDIHTNGAHPVCSGGFSPVVDLLFRCERPQARHQRIMGLLLMALQCDEVHQSGIKQVLELFFGPWPNTSACHTAGDLDDRKERGPTITIRMDIPF